MSKSGCVLTRWVALFLGLSILSNLLSLVVSNVEIAALHELLSGLLLSQQERANIQLQQSIAAVIHAVVFFPTVTLFVLWIYRIYRDDSARGVAVLRHSPGWAVGYFFVPVINLVHPYRVVREIWSSFSPRRPATAEALLLILWWGLYISSTVLSMLSKRLTQWAQEPVELLYADQIEQLTYTVDIAAAVLAIWVVLRIDGMILDQPAGSGMPENQ